MKKLNHILKNIITSNLSGTEDPESIRKIPILNLFSIIGIIFMLYFGLRGLYWAPKAYNIIVFSLTILAITNFIYLRKTQNHKVASYVIVILITLFELYFIITGGEENTGYMWYYIYPIICLFTIGFIPGTIFIASLLLITGILFYIEPDYMVTYYFNQKLRFITTFISVSLLSMVYEYVRTRTYNKLVETNNQNTEYLNQVVKQQEEILAQSDELQKTNNELEQHRNHLESLVKARTIELEIARDKAQESDRLKSAFLENVSHEIRTPMNAIVGFSDILIKENIDSEVKVKLVKHIKENSISLLHLIDNILNVAQIESGKAHIETHAFSINKLMDELLNEALQKIDSKNKQNLKLSLKKGDQITDYTLITDPNRVSMVLSCLLDNAIKFSEKGNIDFGYTIEKKEDQYYLKCYVKDSGIGLSDEQKLSIFNLFTKIEASNEKLYRGTGIGLALSKKTIDLLRGRIWVESKIDLGSVFYFSIPVLLET